MAKPDLVVIDGGLIDAAETPERVDFQCFECSRACVMYPRATPITVQHSMPPCASWRTIEMKADDLARYLIKCGVHVHVPERGGTSDTH
jgi:hypothetical protein